MVSGGHKVEVPGTLKVEWVDERGVLGLGARSPSGSDMGISTRTCPGQSAPLP